MEKGSEEGKRKGRDTRQARKVRTRVRIKKRKSKRVHESKGMRKRRVEIWRWKREKKGHGN